MTDISTRNRRSRGRGNYGERRLASKVKGVVVGRSKFIEVGGKVVKIDPNHPPDVLNSMFSFESKYLSSAPASVTKIMTQAKRNCPDGFTPIGVIGDRADRNVYFIMMQDDFLALHVGGK